MDRGPTPGGGVLTLNHFAVGSRAEAGRDFDAAAEAFGGLVEQMAADDEIRDILEGPSRESLIQVGSDIGGLACPG